MTEFLNSYPWLALALYAIATLAIAEAVSRVPLMLWTRRYRKALAELKAEGVFNADGTFNAEAAEKIFNSDAAQKISRKTPKTP